MVGQNIGFWVVYGDYKSLEKAIGTALVMFRWQEEKRMFQPRRYYKFLPQKPNNMVTADNPITPDKYLEITLRKKKTVEGPTVQVTVLKYCDGFGDDARERHLIPLKKTLSNFKKKGMRIEGNPLRG